MLKHQKDTLKYEKSRCRWLCIYCHIPSYDVYNCHIPSYDGTDLSYDGISILIQVVKIPDALKFQVQRIPPPWSRAGRMAARRRQLPAPGSARPCRNGFPAPVPEEPPHPHTRSSPAHPACPSPSPLPVWVHPPHAHPPGRARLCLLASSGVFRGPPPRSALRARK
jgi:hypothetical protein